MKTFEHFNQGTHICPICGTNEDKPVVLIPIKGTEDGNIMEAAQVHASCLQNNLQYFSKNNVIGCYTPHYYKKDDLSPKTKAI